MHAMDALIIWLVETIARSQGGSLTLTARDGGGLRARLALPNR